MRVSQLLESSDFSALTKVWHGGTFHNLCSILGQMGDDGELLAHIANKAMQKNAVDSPEVIFDLLTSMIRALEYDDVERQVMYEYRRILEQFLGEIVQVAVKMDAADIRVLQSKVDLDKLAKLVDAKLGVKLKLAGWKINRTPEQEQQDEEHDLYVFIGRPGFKELPDGNFKKTLEIERLVKIDRFASEHHQMVAMMKLRARVQGENSEVYQILLPKGTVDDDMHPDDWLVKLIDQHKTRVR